MKSIFYGGDTVITAVGDDKQKIMGWAGAQKNGFRAFEADFLAAGEVAGQQHITLPINYRSNARIVEILNILKRKLAPHEPDFRAARPAPQLPPEEICAVVISPDTGAEARSLCVPHCRGDCTGAATAGDRLARTGRRRSSGRKILLLCSLSTACGSEMKTAMLVAHQSRI